MYFNTFCVTGVQTLEKQYLCGLPVRNIRTFDVHLMFLFKKKKKASSVYIYIVSHIPHVHNWPIYSWSHVEISISLWLNYRGPLKWRCQKKSLIRTRI